MSSQGWIKLHRKFQDWEWFNDSKIVHTFIHCLLSANHKPKKWRGITINPGQFISSQQHLSDALGLSIRQIRTVLDKLKSTGELTVKTTNKYSIISITNWESYQMSDSQDVSQVTHQRQSNDNQMTTNKNVNNEENEKNNITSLSPKADPIPYQKIIDLYHKTLPDLPRVAKLTPKRKGQIRQRYIEDMKALDNWENFFDHVKQSDFLMGRVQPINGRTVFRADIEWLTNQSNFTKIAEGKYHV